MTEKFIVNDVKKLIEEATEKSRKHSRQKEQSRVENLNNLRRKYMETEKQIKAIEDKIKNLQNEKEKLVRKNLNRKDFLKKLSREPENVSNRS